MNPGELATLKLLIRGFEVPLASTVRITQANYARQGGWPPWQDGSVVTSYRPARTVLVVVVQHDPGNAAERTRSACADDYGHQCTRLQTSTDGGDAVGAGVPYRR
jgi:hypothetical protein